MCVCVRFFNGRGTARGGGTELVGVDTTFTVSSLVGVGGSESSFPKPPQRSCILPLLLLFSFSSSSSSSLNGVVFPPLCRPGSDSWTAAERRQFNKGITAYKKDFFMVQKQVRRNYRAPPPPISGREGLRKHSHLRKQWLLIVSSSGFSPRSHVHFDSLK